jgi:hypothetical protein
MNSTQDLSKFLNTLRPDTLDILESEICQDRIRLEDDIYDLPEDEIEECLNAPELRLMRATERLCLALSLYKTEVE